MLITFMRALHPAGFWSRVHVHHRVVQTRLLLWPLTCSALIIALTSLAGYGAIVIDWSNRGGTPLGPQPSGPLIPNDVGALLSPVHVQFTGFPERTSGWRFPALSRRGIGAMWMTSSSRSPRLPSCLLAGVGFILAAGAIVLVSPSEWRRSRVRREHLDRVACYAFAGVLAIQGITSATLASEWMLRACLSGALIPWPIRDLILLEALGFMFFALIAWLSVYWWFALRRGLELKRAWALWIFACIAGVLCAMTVLLFVDESAFREAIHADSWWFRL